MNFNYVNPYPSVRVPVFARNVVATSQPLAAQAGLRILSQGGNAVDAAIAAAAAMTIVEPVSNGLGSDAFAIVWDGKSLNGLNASGTAPGTWNKAYFDTKYGAQTNIPMRGWDSVTVPGAVSAWVALHEKFGRLPFAECLAPAIELGDRGYGVSVILQHKWAAQISVMKDQAGFAQAFMPRGRAPEVGERFTMKNASATLRRIAATNGRDFYEGQTAQSLAAHSKANGGSMTVKDLAEYRPDWVDTIHMNYHGYDLHEIPPNGQGIAALMALGILKNFDIASLGADSLASRHLQIEAMKLAFADVYHHVADSRTMRVSSADLLDAGYLKQRAARIKLDQAGEFNHGLPPSGGTIYLTAADQEGMMVSFIQSNYMGFGSGVVEPSTGVSLQNRGHGFSLDAGSPNCVAPGKRPFQTIIPAFLMKDGKPQMSFGVMGGNMQPQGHLQTLVRMVDFNQNPQAACDAPRWKVNKGRSVDVEASMEADVVSGLAKMGHTIESIADPYMDFGSGQFIWRLSDDLEDGYVAASDSRRDGLAAGY
jgi:gamma-glutamyltranspeptidase / glutathione hydrolase